MKRIDCEAHFYTEDYLRALRENKGYPRIVEDSRTGSFRLWYNPDVGQPFGGVILEDLLDLGEKRLKNMDDSRIDVQVLSLSAPGIEQLDAATGTNLARKVNDDLSKAIRKYPDRFMGFAILAPKNPEEAADELERAVKELGFKGWQTHSNYGDTYLDDKTYWPILERAEKLDVPVYLHPTVPAVHQLGAYGFLLAGAPFGFGVDAATCMMRLIYSGVFDQYPGLKIILGHLGEAFPFMLKRIDWGYVRPYDPENRPKLAKKPSEYFESNVFVTTSGNDYQPAFMCTYEAMGIEKMLLGTDYPYESSAQSMTFLEGLPISKEDKNKIFYLNPKGLGMGLED